MKQGDPTTTAAWREPEPLPDWVVEEPLTRTGAPRGVEPFDITPGAPPVRARGPRQHQRRSLLRDAELRRKLLQKAQATPNPTQRARVRELDTKPPAHERVFFKPANPLVTNMVVDRPPSVKKDPDPTLDPAPTREVSPGGGMSLDDGWFEDDPLSHEWFMDLDGTLEPAQERQVLPPVRVAGFVLGGAVLAGSMLLLVAVLQGSAASSNAEAALPVPVQLEYHAPRPVVPDEPEVGGVVEEVGVPEVGVPEPARFVPAPVRTVSATLDRSPDDRLAIPEPRSIPVPEAFEEPAAPEAAVREVAPPAPPPEPPEGTAELWSERVPDAAEPANLWGHLDE